MEGQLADILAALTRTSSDVGGLSQSLGSLKATVDSLSTRMGSVERSVGTDGAGIRCSKCNKMGHRRRDCPDLKEKKGDEGKE